MSTFCEKKLDQLVRAIFCYSSNILTKKVGGGGGGKHVSGKKDLSKFHGLLHTGEKVLHNRHRHVASQDYHYTCELGRAEHKNKAFILSHGTSYGKERELNFGQP